MYLITRAVIKPPISVLSFFVWETGLAFDSVMNEFQNKPRPVAICCGPGLISNMTGMVANVTGVAS